MRSSSGSRAAALVFGVGLVVTASPARADDKAVTKRHEEQKVSLNFDGTPLLEVLDTLEDLTTLAFVMDAKARALVKDEQTKVSLRLKDVTAKNGLQLALAANEDLTYEVWQGTVFISRASKPAPRPGAFDLPDGAKKAFAEKKLTVNFNETVLSEVGDFLKDTSGVAFKVDAGVKTRRLTLRVKELTVGELVSLTCRVAGLELVKDGPGVLLRAAKEEPAKPDDKGEKKDDPDRSPVAGKGEKIANDIADKKLKSLKLTLNFDATPLSEVAEFLQDFTGLNVVVDKAIDAEQVKVTFKARDVAAKDALDKLAAKAGVKWEISEGLIRFRAK